MELRFDPAQEHQVAAIAAVLGVLDGQPFIQSRLSIPPGAGFQVVANRLDLDGDALLANVQRVQSAAGLPVSPALEMVSEQIIALDGPQTAAFPNFAVEMETGTGKTYAYLRTALEMAERHGLRKFIIVVPSIAVREGVLATLRATKAHFEARYGSYRHAVYDSASLSRLRNFALSDGVEFLVMTIDSFTTGDRVIRQSRDGQDPPIFQLQSVRPVLILDEPQNMETDIRKAALASLRPLFALRYSATHKDTYNLLHRLTPYDAYRKRLVKRIEVASVVADMDGILPFIRVDGIEAKKKTLTATLAVHRRKADGTVAEAVVKVRVGDDLAAKTGRPDDYAGYVVDEVNPGSGYVRFANGKEVAHGEAIGVDKDAILEAQIRTALEEHFRKQRRLRPLGLKVLTLFFVDKVDNYAPPDGKLRLMFHAAFDALKADDPDWASRTAEEVQASYFATKTAKGGAKEAVDTTGRTKADEDAFNLIMRGKERLLSFDEPVAFLFSHSALREGWDNPNVFGICTLREVGTETERRQQVGRGMRLPVDQGGNRVDDDRANVLTVIASESYEKYVQALQGEIRAAYGEEGTPPPPPDRRKQVELRLRKAFLLRPEFRKLWDRIRHRTRYAVTIDTEALVAAVLPALDAVTISSPRIVVTKGLAQVSATEDVLEAIQLSGARTAVDLAGRYPLPNLVEVMEGLMTATTPPMRLSRRTLLRIVKETMNTQAILDNPQAFAVAAVGIIKEKLSDQLVKGIKYEKDGTWYEMNQFVDVIPAYADRIVSSEVSGITGGTHLYDGVPIESETVERPFAELLEKRADVLLYIKLPRWFTVDTPVGTYNPDWALVMANPINGDEELYLVRETKGGASMDDLRPDERRKIECGTVHFREALEVDYAVCRPPFSQFTLP